MTASEKTREVLNALESRGVKATFAQAETLRRAEMVLHRWAEMECGDGNDWESWSIERDEKTGKPFLVTYPHKGETRRRAIPDREKGALRRVREVCAEIGAHFYHQTDPRGCALYVSPEPIKDNDYTNGAACCGGR